MKDKILGIASQCLSDEEIEQIVKNRFMNAIDEAIKDSFKWGDVKKTIEAKIKEVTVPYIESYDFSEYLPKLDTVLTEIVNSSGCKAEKEILENFKYLMIDEDIKEIKVSEIFDKWIKYCNENISTYGLDVNLDDGPHYECVDCNMEVEKEERPSWSSFEYAKIFFENEHDNELNREIRISKWNEKVGWTISGCKELVLSSLQRVSEFDMFLMKLERNDTKIILDTFEENGEIEPEQEPEANWS